MPASVNTANSKLQLKNDSVTEYTEFAGRCHDTCGQEGWEPLADYALAWATHQVPRQAESGAKAATALARRCAPADAPSDREPASASS